MFSFRCLKPSTRTQQILYWTATLGLAIGGSVVLALGAPAWTAIGMGVILLGGAVTMMINLSILYSIPPKPVYTRLYNKV
jgi:hypothetical protein